MIGFCARGTLRLPCPLARFGRSIGSARNHPEGHSLQFSGKMGNLATQMSAFSEQIMMYQWIWGYPIFKPQYGCQQIWLIHNHQSGKHWNTTLSIDIHTLGWPSCSSLSLSPSSSYIYIYKHICTWTQISNPPSFWKPTRDHRGKALGWGCLTHYHSFVVYACCESNAIAVAHLSQNIHLPIPNLSGWWYTYPPLTLKNMSSSVGIMTFPTEWKSYSIHVPNHQPVVV
jgi:hypothetical protein